jgi:hypothetical protein
LSVARGREWALTAWNLLKKSGGHEDAVKERSDKQRMEYKSLLKDPTSSEKERHQYSIAAMKQASMSEFFKIRAPNTGNKTPKSTNLSTSASLKSPEKPTTASLKSPLKESIAKRPQTYKGIFHDYAPSTMKKDKSEELSIYGINCAVSEDSKYLFGLVGSYYQVFSKDCTESSFC